MSEAPLEPTPLRPTPPRRPHWALRSASALTLLVLGGGGLALAGPSLRAYGALAWVAVGAGALLLLAAVVLVARWVPPESARRGHVLGLVVLDAALLLLPLSTFGGHVTHASFGWTVVGLLPIPALDPTIDADGWLGFRTKSHLVTLEEVQALLEDDPDVLVIGRGWDGRVQVPAEVLALGEVEVLTSGEAVARYRALRAEGKRVALLLHSTC